MAVSVQGELAEKDKELAASSIEIEKLLQKIGENTAVAEKEKAKVAVIVSQVTAQAQVSLSHLPSSCMQYLGKCASDLRDTCSAKPPTSNNLAFFEQPLKDLLKSTL